MRESVRNRRRNKLHIHHFAYNSLNVQVVLTGPSVETGNERKRIRFHIKSFENKGFDANWKRLYPAFGNEARRVLASRPGLKAREYQPHLLHKYGKAEFHHLWKRMRVGDGEFVPFWTIRNV
jgi:hypothetical protein